MSIKKDRTMKNCCNIEDRKAHHDPETKIKLTHRINRIEGQIKGIGRMVEDDIYCDDILNQITSVQAALNGVKKTLLEAHLKSCVMEQLSEGKISVIEELLTTIGKMLK